MVHSAYDTFELLNSCPAKIETIGSYASKLLLGCVDGSLRIYGPDSSTSSPSSDRTTLSEFHSPASDIRKVPYVLERTVTGFSKKALLSMKVLESRELLLSLSESIALHRLPNLETVAVVSKAKGANVFSWDDRRGFLCFARQKRVCIFRHDVGRGFVEVKEFGVPDTVKSISWCGENICLGIRREYMIMNSTNGALSEVFPAGRLVLPLVVSLPSGELILGKLVFAIVRVELVDLWNLKVLAFHHSPILTEHNSDRAIHPERQSSYIGCSLLVKGNKSVLTAKEDSQSGERKSNSICRDNIGVFVDQMGKLLPEGRICWSEAPQEIIIQKPYAIALLPRYVEIRSLRVPCPLIQTVVLRNARHLSESANAVVVALDNSVQALFPVPLGAQIVQLTASGNFEEALALCKLLPPEDSSIRAAKESSIHIRYAHHLFENASYEDAMEHFLASQVEITYVLSLYPSMVLPKTALFHDSEQLMDNSWDGPRLSRGSSGLSDDMESAPPPQLQESEEHATLESIKMNHNTLMALIKYLQTKRYRIIEKAAAEGTEKVVFDAVGDNYAPYPSSRFKKSNKGRGNIPVSSGARDMAAILDTALLQALLLTGQSSAALDVLKGLNYCNVKICEEILRNRNQYEVLLELYKCNSMHREALKMLQQLVEDSTSNQSQGLHKFKPEAIIEYLKPICSTDPMLVLEFAMLVLESCPTQTIELFLSGNIPADLVNSYLKQHAPNMQATYLELMLSMNENAISGNLQNEMVQIYLSEVLEWHTDVIAQNKWDEKIYTPTRKKLLSALESISGYIPEALLKRLPADALYEERALLLGKMNQHELALSLYVHKLQLPDMALSYCDRVYDSLVHTQPGKLSGNIYLTLLKIYLNPRKTTKNFEKRITNLVSSSANTNNIRRGNHSVSSAKSKVVRAVKKIAAIEGAEDWKVSASGTDSSKSDGDGDERSEDGEGSTIMLDEVLDLLTKRWDRINGAQAIRLLPRETKLQKLIPFLVPVVKKSSESYRNYAVIKSLRQRENLQVKDEVYSHRKSVLEITGETMCSLCNKKIGTSVFAVYPNGTTLVHFVCFRDSQSMKAVAKGSTLRKR